MLVTHLDFIATFNEQIENSCQNVKARKYECNLQVANPIIRIEKAFRKTRYLSDCRIIYFLQRQHQVIYAIWI